MTFRPTFVKVDLSAITHNYNAFRKHIGNTKLAVAVKANAYGHGIVRISRHLEQLGVDVLLVATVDEAIELRESQIMCDIMVLSEPTTNAIDACIENDLIVTVYSAKFIKSLVEKQKPMRVHLKVDTGMNRVGCNFEEVLEFAQAISMSKLTLEGFFTHLATADDPDEIGVLTQIEKFEQCLELLDNVSLRPPIVHVANSAATIKHMKYHYDMVRVGLSIYGLYPHENMKSLIELKPALSVHTKIGYIKDVSHGEKISYGWHHQFEQDSKVATLPIGYGDGIWRDFGMLGGHVVINERPCDIVGVITMDQTMVDISHIDAKVGDDVTIMGLNVEADYWAKLEKTISYEMLCDLSARLPRIYD